MRDVVYEVAIHRRENMYEFTWVRLAPDLMCYGRNSSFGIPTSLMTQKWA